MVEAPVASSAITRGNPPDGLRLLCHPVPRSINGGTRKGGCDPQFTAVLQSMDGLPDEFFEMEGLHCLIEGTPAALVTSVCTTCDPGLAALTDWLDPPNAE